MQDNGGAKDKNPVDPVRKKCGYRHIQKKQAGTGQCICRRAGVDSRCVQAHRSLYEKPAVQGADSGD